MERKKRIVIGIVALHTTLLACYTFPSALVPEDLRILGQLYARPLFHQHWLLFAPDPPLCSCQLQWSTASHRWQDVIYDDGYLQRRTLQALARHVQSEVQQGDTTPSPPLVRTMRGMVYNRSFDPGRGRTMPELRFRLMENCVVDPRSPMVREERITDLHTP